jgi:GNAT superfamily N-acetyltransferase
MNSDQTSAAAAIRPVEAGDHAAWHALWHGYQTFYAVQIPEATTAVTWRRLLDPAEPMFGAVAFDLAGVPVGLAHLVLHRSTWTVADYCYLQDLYVSQGARGAGIGSALLDYCYDWADANGCARVHWLTHESNGTAQSLYLQSAERSGFVQFRKLLPPRA